MCAMMEKLRMRWGFMNSALGLRFKITKGARNRTRAHFPVLMQFRGPITEPSADRGPQRGSPAGVVDARDAGDGQDYKVLIDLC
jgi:hypothetical protein